jgi:hypothetical protein
VQYTYNESPKVAFVAYRASRKISKLRGINTDGQFESLSLVINRRYRKTRNFRALFAILCVRKGLETNAIWELRALSPENLWWQLEESLSTKKENR